MKKIFTSILVLFSLLILSGCSNNEEDIEKNPLVTMEIEDYGTIKIELYPEYAPNTVANFVSLIENGFYVTCVDKSNKAKELLYEKLQNYDKYQFLNEDFINVNLPKVNLFYTCLSLQFINKKDIDAVMKKINESINEGGFFVRKFFRRR